MGDLMHQGLDGLCLTHAGPEDDPLFDEAGVALRCAGYMVLLHRQGGKCLQPGIKSGKVRHISGQLGYADIRQLPPLCLADVKDSGCLEVGDRDIARFPQGLPVRAVQGLAGLRVLLVLLHRPLIGARRQDFDALLIPFDLPAQLLPGVVSSYPACCGKLEQDQQGVAEAVMVELRHSGQIFRITAAGIELPDAGLQLIGQLCQPFIRHWGHRSPPGPFLFGRLLAPLRPGLHLHCHQLAAQGAQ